MNAREAAYHALLASLREEEFIHTFLKRWKRESEPSERDFRLAQEIANGTMRRMRTLEYWAEKLGPLKLKRKEKVLLLMALYQAKLMDRVPTHAIAYVSVACAKKYCHERFAKFLNATLRKLPQLSDELPEDLGIRYSYPDYFIQELKKQYSAAEVISILEAGNKPPLLMARIRSTPLEMTPLERPEVSPDLYIQNLTPVTLISECSRHLKTPPKKILDLCAAPGGKSLLLHDLYPEAKLWMNDVSEVKTQKIQENLERYGIEATVTQSLGEAYTAEEKFDLIILDVPCSNSGVLNKRPEARWRITKETLDELTKLQSRLLGHAPALLAPNGQIWYMTCSILKQEHSHCPLQNALFHRQITPNDQGQDGGFAAALV